MSLVRDPLLGAMLTANSPLMVMDSDPDEGFVRGRWKGHDMPAGRGNKERRLESSKRWAACYFCRPGFGCNIGMNKGRPRPDAYKCHRRKP